MRLTDFVDRLYIIHLPERVDRYQALKQELANIGIDIQGPKVRFPEPPYPTDAHGYWSIGVYSNFIRHLGILKECLEEGVERVWILEDDAIFRRQMRSEQEQEKLIQRLKRDDWDLCFLGHDINPQKLRSHEKGLTPYTEGFCLAHCYCVHPRVLPKLIAYLEETLRNPSGHPRGGRICIDAAYNLFREFHPEVVTLVTNPNLSNQKGTPSSITKRHWYDSLNITRSMVNSLRSLRDEAWRLNWM